MGSGSPDAPKEAVEGLGHVSAGGVVARQRESQPPEVCMIMRRRHRKESWCLPKGHVEPGESASDAALREVLEETGLRAECLAPLDTIHYEFIEPATKQRCSKRVHFFLMKALSESLAPQDSTEVVRADWLPLTQALAKATYDNERRVLSLARDLLQQSDVAQRFRR